MKAVVIKQNGKPVSEMLLAAIAGYLKGQHGYDAELVEIADDTATIEAPDRRRRKKAA